MSHFVSLISILIVPQHVSSNQVPIIRSWQLRDVIALCWYVPRLQGGGQDRLAGSASDGRTTCQPDLTTSLQPRHIPTQSHSRQLLMMGTWLPETCWGTSRKDVEAQPANRSWQPSCSLGTYQHKAITSRSRQLLMMGTWLPETCWATIRREIKNTKSDT